MRWITLLHVRRAEGEKYLLRRRAVPAIDLSYGDPRLAEVRAAAKADGAGQWPLIRAHLAAARDDEDLAFLVEGLQSVAGVERWAGGVIAADPGDPLPLLVSGARHAARAVSLRTRPWDPHVPDGQRDLFRARLAVAEKQLAEAAERAPSSAAPWYFLQVGGAELGPDVAERRFREACRRVPGHVAAHRRHLRQLAPAWGGSHERMHDFARQATLAAPEGSPLGQLVALAHLRHWLDIGGDPESVFLSRPGPVAALHEAAARSVLHPAFVRHRDWPLAFNAFAMAFALAGEYPAARSLFTALGARATETPWRYLDERSPLLAFHEWRARVNR